MWKGCRELNFDVAHTPDEFRALLTELTEPYRTMVIHAGCLGLARSEFSASSGQTVNGTRQP
jgi:hypothetical protein